LIDWQSLGCFVDNANRVLPESPQSSVPMTVDLCSELCQGYTYFGVEAGNQCFCGNQLPIDSSDGCDYPCSDNSSEICGGVWAINVYGPVFTESDDCVGNNY
jgi:hypothetical protein